MSEYAKRDKKIDHLRCELNHRKELLAGKLSKLSETSKVNRLLTNVLEDYRNHSSKIINDKRRQETAMNNILEHLNEIMQEEDLTEKSLEHAKNQQNEILNEMDSIKTELNKILSNN